MNEIIQTPVNIGPIPVDVVRLPDTDATIVLFLSAVLFVAFWMVLRAIVSLEK